MFLVWHWTNIFTNLPRKRSHLPYKQLLYSESQCDHVKTACLVSFLLSLPPPPQKTVNLTDFFLINLHSHYIPEHVYTLQTFFFFAKKKQPFVLKSKSMSIYTKYNFVFRRGRC